MEIDWQKHAQHLLEMLNGFVAIAQRQIIEINEKNEEIAQLRQQIDDAYNNGYSRGYDDGLNEEN